MSTVDRPESITKLLQGANRFNTGTTIHHRASLILPSDIAPQLEAYLLDQAASRDKYDLDANLGTRLQTTNN